METRDVVVILNTMSSTSYVSVQVVMSVMSNNDMSCRCHVSYMYVKLGHDVVKSKTIHVFQFFVCIFVSCGPVVYLCLPVPHLTQTVENYFLLESLF